MDWQAMAAPWLLVETEMEAAHSPVLDALMARAALPAGARVLDIGIGSGSSLLMAAGVVGPDGHVTGVDIAPSFAARAAARAPANAAVINADAATHAFAPASFDAAISLFGVMFFTDAVAAMANIRSAVRPGGQFTFASWAAPQANPWFGVPARAASEVMGQAAPRDPHAPGPFAFADSARVLDLMAQAGWTAAVETVDLDLSPEGNIAAVADLHMIIGAAAMRMAEEDADAATRAMVRVGLATAFAPWQASGAVRVPARIHIFTATA